MLRDRSLEVTDESVDEARRAVEDLRAGRLVMEPQHASLVGLSFEHVEVVMPLLLGRAWVVCKTPRMMITTDEPVLPVEGPGGLRGQVGGMGSAGAVVFPLSPTETLAMLRQDVALRLGMNQPAVERIWPDRLDELETAQLVKELVAHAHRWTFEVPDRRRVSTLKMPPAVPATDVERGLELDGEPGELIRFFKPNRWSQADRLPPWPVERWWPR
jgi:hypothetical protein